MRKWLAAAVLVAVCVASAAAHDLFLILDSFFVEPQSNARVQVMNGTFTTSDGAVARERLRDLALVAHGERIALDRRLWDSAGPKLSVVYVPVSEAGTYVLGASLLSREITLQASDFNAYLAEEGILPIIELRGERGETNTAARERYHKHVKAILQAGAPRTQDFDVVLGYPAELVPLENPYMLRRGDTLRVRALVDGQGVANQVVIAGGRTRTGARIPQQRILADETGIARLRLSRTGRWYVKFIHMQPVAADSVDYESKWATLTFEIR
jgi:uncharacterized GH25 family protein